MAAQVSQQASTSCGAAHGGTCLNRQPKPSRAALRQPQKKELAAIAANLVSSGKGIFAADESTVTMGTILDIIGLKNDEEIRRQYRQMLLTAGKEAFHCLSGVIFFHETLYQKDDEGVPLIKRAKDNDALIGIRLDKGPVPLLGTENELISQGLDGLENRCKRYKLDGCDFAKWRSVFNIGENLPSHHALASNAETIARYAACCQQAGLVPIIQTEFKSEGNCCLQKAEEVMQQVLGHVYRALDAHHVWIEGTILATDVVDCGNCCQEDSVNYSDAAGATLVALLRTVPASVPGIAFVIDGNNEEKASSYLDALAKFPSKKPWNLTFCFGCALQYSALTTWKGEEENVAAAQQQFALRTKSNGLAVQGRYKMVGDAPGKKLIPPEQLY